MHGWATGAPPTWQHATTVKQPSVNLTDKWRLNFHNKLHSNCTSSSRRCWRRRCGRGRGRKRGTGRGSRSSMLACRLQPHKQTHTYTHRHARSLTHTCINHTYVAIAVNLNCFKKMQRGKKRVQVASLREKERIDRLRDVL